MGNTVIVAYLTNKPVWSNSQYH